MSHLRQPHHHYLGAVLHQSPKPRVAGAFDLRVVEKRRVCVYQRVGPFLDNLRSLWSCDVWMELGSLAALDAVVGPEHLLVGRVPLEGDLVKHLDVFHPGVRHGEPRGVQLPEAEVGVEGDVVLGVPVLAVQHLQHTFRPGGQLGHSLPGTRCPSWSGSPLSPRSPGPLAPSDSRQ